MSQVYDRYQVAVKADPNKEGVRLYLVRDAEGKEAWVWARAKKDAIYAMAVRLGITAHLNRLGVTVDEEVPDGSA